MHFLAPDGESGGPDQALQGASRQARFLSVEEEELLCQKLRTPFGSWVRLAILTGMRQ